MWTHYRLMNFNLKDFLDRKCSNFYPLIFCLWILFIESCNNCNNSIRKFSYLGKLFFFFCFLRNRCIKKDFGYSRGY